MKKSITSILIAVVLLVNSILMMTPTVFAENSTKATSNETERGVKAVSLGYSQSAAIMQNGDLYCWGYNNDGQVGNGTRDDQLTPVKVLSNVAEVSLDDYNSAAITQNGDLYCWGFNFDGQVGNGTRDDQLTPVKVLSNVAEVSLDNYHNAAITQNGDLYCWGSNANGQVGNGEWYAQLTPVKVLSNVTKVSLGFSHSAAITQNGDLYCWGYNANGQVGNGTKDNQRTPVKVLSNVSEVSLGFSYSAAITQNGDLYCWGSNFDGQVGNGTEDDQLTPVKVLSNVVEVSLEYSHSAAITQNGDLYCWGNNGGKVGNGTEDDQLTPVKVLSNVSEVSLNYHSAAITQNGDLYCWGYNLGGEIGNGTMASQLTPVKVLSNVVEVSLCDYHSAAITQNGDLYCWGSNRHGQVGNGTMNSQLTPIKVLGNISTDTQQPSENKLQCTSACLVEEGHNQEVVITAFEDDLDKLRTLTDNITWKSGDTNIATVDDIGFILPTNATEYSSENGTYQTWRATGLLSVYGVSEGTTTITGTASDGSNVTFQVTVTEPEEAEGDTTEESGGNLVLGEKSSGSAHASAAKFFPANWSLKSSVFPVEISKSETDDGSYTIRGTVGIRKSDWMDDDATWGKYKKTVSDANKYTGRVDCLKSYKDTWDVKSVTAVTTDKFEALPKLSVMGYFENTYDKNGNLVSATGKLAADAKWSGSINWQFVTPIGPLYLNLSGSGKLSGSLEPKYNYDKKSLEIANGNLKFTPSVTLEGGYGIDKVATIGAQGTLSVPITIVPVSKEEFEAKAAVHVKLVFIIDWTHDLATYKTTLWDTKKKSRTMSAGNTIYLSEGKLSEMDTSFHDFAGEWNPDAATKKARTANRSISDTIADSITMLQEGILPSALPIQTQIGGKNVMVFQAYDPARTTLNSTVLKYSVLENGVWSEPKAVFDNGCADLYADMKVVNGKLALVWQKEKKTITGNVETDGEKVLKNIAENSEIYFSLFDEATNTFMNPVSVTNNNFYDMMPRIVSANDYITVAWVRNDKADLMQETGSNTIYTAKWNGSSFEEEVSLSKAAGTVDDYVVYQDGNGLQTVFTGQANGITAIFDTNGDVIDSLSGHMMASENGKISSLNYAEGKVCFVSGGMLYSYDPFSKKLTSAKAGESAFGSAVQYCSNGEKTGYIWSIYDEETNMGRILASMKTENGYSEPITICEKENAMWRYFSPVMNEDGNWEIVANALNTETNTNSLLYVTKKAESRLELAGASIDENDVVDGLTGIDYFVTNTEDTTINNIEIEIELENGSKIVKTIPVTLLPGESKAGTVYVELKNVDHTQDVNLSVFAENQLDKSDCVVADKIGQSDILVDAISSETADEVMITATLKNLSSVDSIAALHLYGDEEKKTELQKQEGISLSANGHSQVQFTVNKNDIIYNENQAAYLVLHVVTQDGDYNEDNNTAYIILYQPGSATKYQLGDVNKDGRVDLQDVQITLRAALHIVNLTDEEKETADVNHDGSLTLSDAQKILRAVLRIITL